MLEEIIKRAEGDLRSLLVGRMPVRDFYVRILATQNSPHIEDRMTVFELVSVRCHIAAHSLIKMSKLRFSSERGCFQVCSLLPPPTIMETTGNTSPTCPHI